MIRVVFLLLSLFSSLVFASNNELVSVLYQGPKGTHHYKIFEKKNKKLELVLTSEKEKKIKEVSSHQAKAIRDYILRMVWDSKYKNKKGKKTCSKTYTELLIDHDRYVVCTEDRFNVVKVNFLLNSIHEITQN